MTAWPWSTLVGRSMAPKMAALSCFLALAGYFEMVFRQWWALLVVAVGWVVMGALQAFHRWARGSPESGLSEGAPPFHLSFLLRLLSLLASFFFFHSIEPPRFSTCNGVFRTAFPISFPPICFTFKGMGSSDLPFLIYFCSSHLFSKHCGTYLDEVSLGWLPMWVLPMV